LYHQEYTAKTQLNEPFKHGKNHFITGLTIIDSNFPLHLWCRFCPLADLTLNLLRQSRINPNLSAYAQIFGAFYFNAKPLVPPGTKAIIHDKPMSLDVSASLSDDFSESDLPWKVDIVDWAKLSDAFRKIIAQDKVVVQSPWPPNEDEA